MGGIINPSVSGVVNNYAATSSPAATNDNTQGYSVGSAWFRIDTGDSWRCRDATTNAAVWTRLDVADFMGYVAGNWYVPFGQAAVTGNANPTAGRIWFLPWINKQRFTMSALGLRVGTVSAGGNCAAALYGTNPTTKRPTGTPIVSTGSLSTTTAASVNGAVSAQLEPGLFFLAGTADNTTAVLIGAASANNGAPSVAGSATEGNVGSTNNATLQFYYNATFGTWPDMTSLSVTESLSAGNYTPLPHFQVGSVP